MNFKVFGKDLIFNAYIFLKNRTISDTPEEKLSTAGLRGFNKSRSVSGHYIKRDKSVDTLRSMTLMANKRRKTG